MPRSSQTGPSLVMAPLASCPSCERAIAADTGSPPRDPGFDCPLRECDSPGVYFPCDRLQLDDCVHEVLSQISKQPSSEHRHGFFSTCIPFDNAPEKAARYVIH